MSTRTPEPPRALTGVETGVIGDHPDEEIRTYRRWWGERRIDGVVLLGEHDLVAQARVGGRRPGRR